MRIVEQYLLQLNTEKQRFRRFFSILTVLSLVVVLAVFWNLRITGITLANDACCGRTEHQHDQTCISEKILICEDLEDPSVPEDTLPPHVHTDHCYQISYGCGYEAHIHTIDCYSDSTADIETAAQWKESLPDTTGIWAEDIVNIARSQIGNGESERNYLVSDDGQTRNGITRYGQWYGNPYGDWSAMFVMFCLNYVEVPEETVPWSPGVHNMMRLALDQDILHDVDTFVGITGNILFLDTDDNGNADRMLIVSASSDEELTAIGGDWEDVVQEVILTVGDPRILGYIHVATLQEPWLPEAATESTAATAPPSDEPAISVSVEFPEQENIIRLVALPENIDETAFTWQWQVSEDGNEPWYDIETATGLAWEIQDIEEVSSLYYRLQARKIPMMFAANPTATDGEQSGEWDPDSDIINSDAVMALSVGKESNVYVVDVYAFPVDASGNRIPDIAVTQLSTQRINSTTKKQVQSFFNNNLGTYKSAFFGTETSATVDNIASVWRYRRGSTYYLAYAQTNGTQNQQWRSNADKNVSLYLRYVPNFTVTFESDGFLTQTQEVAYGAYPSLTEPGTWTRDGYTLLGWTVDNDIQNVYTYEELLRRPVTQDVIYTAQWANFITVSFNLGDPAPDLYPIEPMVIPYGSSVAPLPTPGWRNYNATMAFDGWYLNQEFTQPVTAAYQFHADTVLYAKWRPVEDGYFVYFMDFDRGEQLPLVLMTYSVTEGNTTSPYVPANAPAGSRWDGVWYLDQGHTSAYNFNVPVSQMSDYLTGANGRDLYLYPGTQAVCRAIFVTYGTKIDPVTVPVGESVDLDQYIPKRDGYTFAGWTLKDGTPVSGRQTLTETTTYYATWSAGYVPFEAILRIENANDTGMTQDNVLGTWYAKAGSQIVVESTYSGTGTNRTGTHNVVCVLNGVEYPVYTDAALTQKATLSDVYATYFVYNNTGTTWTDSVNWDDIYTGGQMPYSTRPISSTGDTIINFDYMRVRDDVVFTIPNSSSGGYIDVYKLYQSGLITGSVTYTNSRPNGTGQNVSATGISAQNIRWTYTAASSVGSNQKNTYTLHDMKYGQRIFEVYPVGTSWLTQRSSSVSFHQYRVDSNQLFASRREDLTSDFFSGTGRKVTAYGLTAEFEQQERIALMYAVECLSDETPDFNLNGKGYKVQTHLCEVVRHTGGFGIKDLSGCEPGANAAGTNDNSNYYTKLNTTTATVGGTSVKTLFGTTYWQYYSTYVNQLSDINRAYIFYYDRTRMNIQFNFGYDSDEDGSNEIVEYQNIAFGEKIEEFQFGSPDFARHPLLDREGYEFVGWMDANGHVLEPEAWTELVASGDSEDSAMVFIAKWEKISNNIVEYYEDRSSDAPFETHYFDDGELLQYPTMAVYPEGWVWQEYGEDAYDRFDWDVPMYGEYGVQELRQVNGEERVMNVIRIYGTWDESHTRVVYDPNPPQGGIPGSAPTDANEYTIWQSLVPVAPQGNTANSDSSMVFSGWLLDRDGIVYQPGDHVQVHWPRTMIFTAQWAKAEELVHLRYDPNGGSPTSCYPNDAGYSYKMNASAAVWDNMDIDGSVWFTRVGYTFTGWNTQPDGSGTAYAPDSIIVLNQPVTTLYAQWDQLYHTMTLEKIDADSRQPLTGAVFSLYQKTSDVYRPVESLTTPVNGTITFQNLETDVFYKLVEDKAPNGYAIVVKEIYFRLKAADGTISLEFYDAQGSVISQPAGVTAEYVTGNRVMTMVVDNLRGYALPATGGIGIPVYILCGLMLISAPLVYGFSLRCRYRKGARV